VDRKDIERKFIDLEKELNKTKFEIAPLIMRENIEQGDEYIVENTRADLVKGKGRILKNLKKTKNLSSVNPGPVKKILIEEIDSVISSLEINLVNLENMSEVVPMSNYFSPLAKLNKDKEELISQIKAKENGMLYQFCSNEIRVVNKNSGEFVTLKGFDSGKKAREDGDSRRKKEKKPKGKNVDLEIFKHERVLAKLNGTLNQMESDAKNKKSVIEEIKNKKSSLKNLKITRYKESIRSEFLPYLNCVKSLILKRKYSTKICCEGGPIFNLNKNNTSGPSIWSFRVKKKSAKMDGWINKSEAEIVRESKLWEGLEIRENLSRAMSIDEEIVSKLNNINTVMFNSCKNKEKNKEIKEKRIKKIKEEIKLFQDYKLTIDNF
jgi:hypothetical protein